MADQPQREWFEKDFYKVLGVPESATPKEITRAYRKLARESHPDAKPGDRAAEERFKEVSAAYDVLGDADKRARYDEVRRLGPMGGFGGFGAGSGGGGGFDTGDLGDLLGGLFGRGRRGGTGGGPGPHRGSDLEAELHLEFDDSVRGLTTAINLTSEAACSACHGSGAAPGTAPHKCPACGGRGVLDDNQGLFSFSQLCTTCAGRGVVVDTPCASCRGTGRETRPRQVKVRIPSGVADGQRIRLKGRGGPGRNGGPPGDLYVVVHVRPHRLFGRRGRDLTITVPVTFPEAALGAELAVPTMNGADVTMRIPPGTPTGKTFRVRGRGLPPEGKHVAGDLLVTVEIMVPQHLNRAERKAIEALAAATTESPRARLASSGEAER